MIKFSHNYSFYEHYHVVHITSQLSDFQLAWAINNKAKVNFRKLPDLMVYQPKTAEYLPHSIFEWISTNAIDYFLITSSEKQNILTAETFLLVEKREHKDAVKRFIEKASSFDFIFSIEEISFNTPSTTPKQRKLIDYLNDISIDMEPYLDKLREKPKYKPLKKEEGQ